MKGTSARGPSAGSGAGQLLAALLLGLLAGALVLAVGALETKWVVYFTGGVGFVTLLLTLTKAERFLWLAFVSAFQVDVSVRLLYGYADSAGISIQFCSLFGALFLLCYAISRYGRFRPLWAGDAGRPLLLLAAAFLIASVDASSHFIALTAIVTYLQYYFFFFLALNVLGSERRLDATVKALLAILVVQSLVYFVQAALGVTFTLTGRVLAETALPRPGGTVATTPASFSMFIFAPLFIAVAIMLSYRLPRALRVFAGVAALLGFSALIMTYTRAAWAAFALGMLWLCWFALRRRMTRPWLLGAVAIVGGIAAMIALPIVLSGRGDNPLDAAFDERFALMEMAYRVIVANPLTGVGPGAYGTTFKTYLTPELARYWVFIVHNAYLLMTAEFGLVGGVALVLWLWCGIATGLKLGRDPADSPRAALDQALGLGASAAFVALAFEMYWEPMNGLYGMTPLVPYWFLLGLVAARALKRRASAPLCAPQYAAGAPPRPARGPARPGAGR